jgi:ATP-dependent RNA helicase RhlE
MALVSLLRSEAMDRVIVFTRTKHGADKLQRDLAKAGIDAAAIHGNKSQNQRERALAAFKAPRPPVLIATDIAARGIDVDGVSHVVNYELPHEPETYVHRIGRTGRAGQTGAAVSFCDPEERQRLRAIEKLLRQPIASRNAPPTGGEVEPADEPRAARPRGRSPSQSQGHEGGGRRARSGGGRGRRPRVERHERDDRQDRGPAVAAAPAVATAPAPAKHRARRRHRRAL